MDLLVEKLDGSRYYLSQYKVLITDFEESAPSVTRNSKQLDQRNGNIDFGGWHTDKTINITGYYRADDIDEEETLREKLYALLSDPDGYYITQLKTTPSVAMERPGETSGSYYDKLKDYPSHKRFLVYTEAPEMELVGNVNGTLLYKLTAEFKTMKLPYGETPAIDIAIDNMPYKDVPVNLLTGTSNEVVTIDATAPNANTNYAFNSSLYTTLDSSKTYAFSADVAILKGSPTQISVGSLNGNDASTIDATINNNHIVAIITPPSSGYTNLIIYAGVRGNTAGNAINFSKIKLEVGSAPTPWSPNPADPEYNSWYYKIDGTASIPYSGTVPCNQLEQQFAIELTAMGAASSLSFKIDDTEFTYSGGVASGDVFLLTGFSYTKNGLSIVSKTNKAYFVFQPDKPNRITCNVPGTVRILGFQNLYA